MCEGRDRDSFYTWIILIDDVDLCSLFHRVKDSRGMWPHTPVTASTWLFLIMFGRIFIFSELDKNDDIPTYLVSSEVTACPPVCPSLTVTSTERAAGCTRALTGTTALTTRRYRPFIYLFFSPPRSGCGFVKNTGTNFRVEQEVCVFSKEIRGKEF